MNRLFDISPVHAPRVAPVVFKVISLVSMLVILFQSSFCHKYYCLQKWRWFPDQLKHKICVYAAIDRATYQLYTSFSHIRLDASLDKTLCISSRHLVSLCVMHCCKCYASTLCQPCHATMSYLQQCLVIWRQNVVSSVCLV